MDNEPSPDGAALHDQPSRIQEFLSRVQHTTSAVLAMARDHHNYTMIYEGTLYAAKYFLEVLKATLYLLRTPLSLLLFVHILSLILLRVYVLCHAILSPLCWLPGVSKFPICSSPPSIVRWADYPSLMDVQETRMVQLMDQSAGNIVISWDIKKAEMATSDLIALVKASDLRSRDLLASHLSQFVTDAKVVSRRLQKLSAHIGGAVDSIMAVNDYALHTIENSQEKTHKVFGKAWPTTSDTDSQHVVRDTFIQAMSVFEAQIRRIVLEAEASLHALAELEEQLQTIHTFVAREDSALVHARTNLLSELWTKCGGNKKVLRHIDSHISLLANVGEYRKRATAQVSAALQTLQGMSEDMEDLRERVAAPDLMGEQIPVSVHMRSIQGGLDRLQADRNRFKRYEKEAIRRMLETEAA
ncbi:hypothetical protein EIP86_000119 [Pleurotus ostreatoroseus]|nr:hypothetical protein EIP86_000119 [Pleurotus ostreatoroseus]